MKYTFPSFFFLLLSIAYSNASAQGIITTIAGGGSGGSGSLATNAALTGPNDVYVDDTGNIYIAEDYYLWKVEAATGIIKILAGNGNCLVGGDGIPLSQARFCGASAIAADKQGNLYIADQGNFTVRKIDKTTGIISKYAGNFSNGYSGDGGLAVNAQLRGPRDIAFDTADNMYIADEYYMIRRVDRQTGIITTIAGDGIQGTWSNGDTASKSRIGAGRGICVDNMGNIYFTDPNDRKIGKINTHGILSTYCGTGIAGITGDGGLAINAPTYASVKLRMDKHDNMYFGDGCRVIRKINYLTGIIERIAGGNVAGDAGEGGAPLNALLNCPVSVFLDKKNNAFIGDALNYKVKKIAGVVGVDVVQPIFFNIYPNPSNGIFTIACEKTIDNIEITNLLGQSICKLQPKNSRTTVNITGQPDGVYIVSVLADKRMTSQKILIHH
ncbi:MAG TPA: T9SS type A sorting domain-containing protein [Flavipsychrobacter sp.]|nr:T9SS type A sorting domain-containing protein [Flavipsychrobacter sp.]